MGLVAAMTRPWQPAAFTGALVALFAVFAEYGWRLSDTDIERWSAVLLAGLALAGVRPQATPLSDPDVVWLNRQKDGTYAR
jgi:hypothetical protein